MLELFYCPGTCALATHIALEEAGAEVTPVRVDFAKKEQQGAAYLGVNPKGRVPALRTERGILTETPALLAWVAQTWPEARLAPDDPWDFAAMQAFNAYLCATLHVAHAHKHRGYRWADDPAAHEAMRRKVPESVGACWEYVENQAFRGPFVMGEQYTVADPYLFTVAEWIEGDGIDPRRFPKVLAHMEMMRDRPAVRRALAAEGR